MARPLAQLLITQRTWILDGGNPVSYAFGNRAKISIVGEASEKVAHHSKNKCDTSLRKYILGYLVLCKFNLSVSSVKKFNWYPDSSDNGLLFQRLVSAQDLKKKKRCLNYIFVIYNRVMWLS